LPSHPSRAGDHLGSGERRDHDINLIGEWDFIGRDRSYEDRLGSAVDRLLEPTDHERRRRTGRNSDHDITAVD
jgi:hypothetical protein